MSVTVNADSFLQIRNACALVSCNQVRFLIDPMLGPKGSQMELPFAPGPFPAAELPFALSELPEFDAIIATHLHSDHFDETAIKVLPKDKPVFSQDAQDAAVLKQWGFTDVRLLPLAGMEFHGVRLYRVNGMHGDFVKCKDCYDAFALRPESSGVVFEFTPAGSSQVRRVYLAGDTIWCDFVAQAIQHYQPDCVVLNAARAVMPSSDGALTPILTGPEDFVKVHAMLPEARLIATHMDCVPHATAGRADVRSVAARAGLQNLLSAPEDGESTPLFLS